MESISGNISGFVMKDPARKLLTTSLLIRPSLFSFGNSTEVGFAFEYLEGIATGVTVGGPATRFPIVHLSLSQWQKN